MVDPFIAYGLFDSGSDLGVGRQGQLMSILSLALAGGCMGWRSLEIEELGLCLSLSLACQLFLSPYWKPLCRGSLEVAYPIHLSQSWF